MLQLHSKRMPTKDRTFYTHAVAFTSDNNKGIVITPTQRRTIKVVRTRTGVSNPRYRQQIRDQVNAGTAMDGIFDFVESEWGTAFVRYKSGDRCLPDLPGEYEERITGDLALYALGTNENSFGWSTSANANEARNRALISYLKNVRQEQVRFSGPTFAGELRESIEMIRHPAKGLRGLCLDYYTVLHGRKRKKPKQWKRDISSIWLEQAFGWGPLLADIANAWKAYKGLSERKSQTPVRGYGKSEDLYLPMSKESSTFPVGNANIAYHGPIRAIDRYEVRYKGMVKGSADSPKVELLDTFGFEPLEWVPTVWELLPWSFLIDYFSNIGDVIQANCAFQSSLAWTNISTVRSQSFEIAAGIDSAKNKQIWGGVGGCRQFLSDGGFGTSAKHVRRTVNRVPGVTLGTPRLSVEIPGQPAQWANMTALMAQFDSNLHTQRLRVLKFGKRDR